MPRISKNEMDRWLLSGGWRSLKKSRRYHQRDREVLEEQRKFEKEQRRYSESPGDCLGTRIGNL